MTSENKNSSNTGESGFWNMLQSLATILASGFTSIAHRAANSGIPDFLAKGTAYLTDNDDRSALKHFFENLSGKKSEFAWRFNDPSIQPTWNDTDVKMDSFVAKNISPDAGYAQSAQKVEYTPHEDTAAAEPEKHADAGTGGGYPNIRNFNVVRGEPYNPPVQQSENSDPVPVKAPATTWVPGGGKAA